MGEDISGFGSKARIVASNTFPSGFEVTQFADDSDPIDVPSLQISDSAMGLNGDKVNWVTANPIPVTMNVIAGSEDDKNLTLLFEANRAGRNKSSAKDVLTMLVTYPDGDITTFTVGSCQEFMPAKSIASDGRLKSKAFIFSFENQVTAQVPG